MNRVRPGVSLAAGLLSLLAACGEQSSPTAASVAPEEVARSRTPQAPPSTGGAIRVDPAIPSYQKVGGVSGNLSSVGSDTMNNLMTLWAEAFSGRYPSVKVQVEGKDSSTAPPALIAETAQLGPMSRQMKSSELDAFEKKHGYKPLELRTSFDALAIFVNKDNPLEKITLTQADAAFSKTPRSGSAKDVSRWGDLGLTGDWAGRAVSLYGRNSASGTYGFFKEHVLDDGDYKDTVKEQPGSASVVQGITADLYGLGYSGIGYKTSGVKALPLAEKEGGTFSSGSYEDVVSGKYPLSRFLYLYVNRAPGKPLDPIVKEFLKLVYSREGQEVVVKDGYLPLTAALVKEEVAKLE